LPDELGKQKIPRVSPERHVTQEECSGEITVFCFSDYFGHSPSDIGDVVQKCNYGPDLLQIK